MAASPRTIRLRKWQKTALDAFRARDGDDFLAVATPGAGKTTFALAAARQDLAAHPGRRLVVVAPTQHLKGQWAQAAEGFELQLADAPHLESVAAEQSPVARRRALRDANAVLVRAIAGATGMSHAQVNGELNRLSGVSRVAEADADALDRRRSEGARWLTRISARSGTRGR